MGPTFGLAIVRVSGDVAHIMDNVKKKTKIR